MRYYQLVDHPAKLSRAEQLLESQLNEILLEGFLDSAKQFLDNKVNQSVTVVSNTTQAVQVLYKVCSNPKFLDAMTFLLKKSVSSKLKQCPNSKLKQAITNNWPQGRTIKDFFVALIYEGLINAFSKTFLVAQSADQAKDQVIEWLVSKITSIESWISSAGDATGIFTLFKSLKIGNELVFNTLSYLNKKINYGASLIAGTDVQPKLSAAANPSTAAI